MRKLRQIVGAGLAAAGLLGGAVALDTVAAAPASSAGYGWVYISMPTWLNNCPSGGSVKSLNVMIGDTWSGGDSGDDVVYGKGRMGESQTAVAQGFCVNGNKRPYYGPAVSQTIRPTRNNQTWWVGPAGVRSN